MTKDFFRLKTEELLNQLLQVKTFIKIIIQQLDC